jgi:hypothetical protein
LRPGAAEPDANRRSCGLLRFAANQAAVIAEAQQREYPDSSFKEYLLLNHKTVLHSEKTLSSRIFTFISKEIKDNQGLQLAEQGNVLFLCSFVSMYVDNENDGPLDW